MIKSETDELRKFTLALAASSGVGPVTFQKLFQIHNTIDVVYTAFKAGDLPIKLTNEIRRSLTIDWEVSLKEPVKYVCVWEPEYPRLLRQITDPPIVLFYIGNPELLAATKLVSVVGTRKYTSYGKTATTEIVSELARSGVTIVSGMAFGIDALAHLATVSETGQTIAVLPGPVDAPIPVQNSYIYERILKSGGLVISEIFPGAQVNAGMFAHRNRIVAGISPGTLVIEAGERSGALITANLAFDYAREVMSLPGRITDNSSSGTNQLIRSHKSSLVTSANDVLACLGYTPSLEVENRILSQLSVEEQRLVVAVSTGGKLEDICALVDSTPDDVISLLMLLQVRGVVGQDEYGDYFVISQK